MASNGKAALKQTKRMGVYHKENYLENEKFVFKHQDRDEFLYKSFSGNWVVIVPL